MDMTFFVGLMVGLFPVIAQAQVIAARLHIPFALILTGTRAIIGLGITALADGKLVFRTRHDGRGCKQRCKPGGAIHVCGDHPLSLDSRISGLLSREDIAGGPLMVWGFEARGTLRRKNTLEG